MAKLLIQLNKAEAKAGELVEATVLLDTQGASVNALEGSLVVPKGLDLISVRDGSSFVTVWIERPALRGDGRGGVDHKIWFSGIVPGGYAGDIGPYWAGARPGEAFTLVLRAKAEGSQPLSASLDSLLANDGLGTQVAVVPARASVLVAGSGDTETYSNAYDVTPPEPFEVLVADMPGTEGVKAAFFDTYDTNSGIAFYMVREGREGEGEFAPAESPYALSHGLRGEIAVRAYDRAGNIREENLAFDPYPQAGLSLSTAFWATLVVLLCAALFMAFRKR